MFDPVIVVLLSPAESWNAPMINLFLKSGVPLDPLHNDHPVGIVAIEPDHIIIPPRGIDPYPPIVDGALTVKLPVILVLPVTPKLSVILTVPPEEFK